MSLTTMQKEKSMRRSISTTMLSGALALGLASCGGNDSRTEPQLARYEGAATAGDYATLSVSGSTLSYNLTGANFGPASGTAPLNPLFGNFWRSTPPAPAFDVLLTDNLAVAKVPVGSGLYAYVVGLQTEAPPNPNSIANKHYLYIEVKNDNTTSGWDVYIQDNAGVKTFTATSIGGGSASGCWKPLGNHLVAKSNLNDCSAITDANADYRFVIKPGNSRNGIVVDYVDGSGFGIGLEQVALTASDFTGVYDAYYQETGGDGFSRVTVNGANFSWAQCPGGNCLAPSITGSIVLNQLCSGLAYSGVACATDSNGDTYNLLIDPDDNYYFAIGYSRGYLEVGSR